MPQNYINPGKIQFSAKIEIGSSENSWAYVTFPYDLKETFGVGNLVPFRATFDKRVAYSGSLAKVGGPHAMILLRKDIRAEINKQPGDTVEVELELDEKPREIVTPGDLEAALRQAKLSKAFLQLAFSHRREYIRWVIEAKKPETRQRRIQKTVEAIARNQ